MILSSIELDRNVYVYFIMFVFNKYSTIKRLVHFIVIIDLQYTLTMQWLDLDWWASPNLGIDIKQSTYESSNTEKEGDRLT